MQKKDYHSGAKEMRERLKSAGPSFCLAKWKMVSLHLTNGRSQSCYHPPAHAVKPEGLEQNPAGLHNTPVKIKERAQMRKGERPEGCAYCWKAEDAGHLSDRHYRSSESWAVEEFEKILGAPAMDESVAPSYVEVNFNQACNFKCIYCSPHLSSEWQKEIENFGPIRLDGRVHNDISQLSRDGRMPSGAPNSENPYVQAFWAWWPRLYPELKVFRMTGGEPLLDANTWKVLDYVALNPKPDLELSITTNLCPPKREIFEKLVARINKLEEGPSLRQFLVYVSCDSVGAQAEYIRTGMNYNLLKQNVRDLLRGTREASVSLINTFNALSLPRLREFLGWVLSLREEFAFETQTRTKRQRIWFDIPFLSDPVWLNARLLAGTEWEAEIEKCIAFMKENLQKDDYETSFRGFKSYEVEKLERNLALMSEGFSAAEQQLNQRRLAQFTDELDHRRGTNFGETFPELVHFLQKPD